MSADRVWLSLCMAQATHGILDDSVGVEVVLFLLLLVIVNVRALIWIDLLDFCSSENLERVRVAREVGL